MGDSEHINATVETIDMLIVSATEQWQKNKKRSDEQYYLNTCKRKEIV